ncbi:DNA polymerase I [Vibrio splendidus]|nr:DNA polymerase I [Vibrio splendidus]MCC4880706.1 DNA polymerase I [Vibrio splendidus]
MKQNADKTYVVIDGNSLYHRAFHAVPALSNKDGFPTNAITGFLNMVNRVLTNIMPDKVVVAFDHSGKTFRNDMYDLYKANRPPTDPLLKQQVQPIKDIVEAWGLPMLSVPHVEADDSITTLAMEAEKEGYIVYVVTSDKDMYQMVSDRIFIVDTKATEKNAKFKEVACGIDGTFKKFGVYPHQIIDFLTLQGDSSDNIPGIVKCGDKTAAKWIATYGSVEAVIENAEKIGGKTCQYILDAAPHLPLSKQLVTIKTDVELPCKPSEFEGCRDDSRLYELTKVYGLHSFRKALGIKNMEAESVVTEFISDEQAILKDVFTGDLTTKFNKPTHFEMFSFDSGEQTLFGGGIVDHLVLFLEDKYYVIDTELFHNEMVSLIKATASLNEFSIVSNSTKCILKLFARLHMSKDIFRIPCADIRVQHYISFGGLSKEASIEALNNAYAEFNLNELRKTHKLETANPRWDKMSFEQTAVVILEEMQVAQKAFNKKAISTEGEEFNYQAYELDSQIIPILAMMELNGCKVNSDKLKAHGKYLTEKLAVIEAEIFAIAGKSFNVNSPKQVQGVLFDDLQINCKSKSTAEKVLKDLAKEHRIVELILMHRGVSKQNSTYVEGILTRLTNDDYVHATYKQAVASTGRLSCTDPNLQSIPVRTEDGRKIRAAFEANKGNSMLAIDFSQIELRILAERANEAGFIKVFQDGGDIHISTAMETTGKAEEDISSDDRRNAKSVNFGLVYDISEKGLAKEIGTDVKTARAFMKTYFEKYPAIKPYFDNELAFAKEHGYVVTMMGRKINASDLNSPNSMIRSHAEKSIKNAGIQASASEIIKCAMIAVFNYIMNSTVEIRMIMQVHDELVFEVPDEHMDSVKADIQTLMDTAATFIGGLTTVVPLVTEAGVASNWAEAH